MSDIRLNANGSDIDLTGLELSLVEGNEAIAQEVRIGMRFFRGEWRLDRRVGIDYFGRIFGQKGARPEDVAAVYRQALLSIPGVVQVDSVLVTLVERGANVRWRVVTDEGAVIEGAEALVLA
jgi:hypothetical protein